MSFLWPIMLFSLLLIPLFVVLYLRIQQRRRQMVARFGTLGIVRDAARRPVGWRRHVPPTLFLAGLTLLLVALARPQAAISMPRMEGIVILAFDVSGSMAATDLEPTRMEAAKEAARNFVLRQPPTIQIGVVAFSDSGFAVQPPTSDQEAILATIARLGPERGTSLAHGIQASLNTIFVDEEDNNLPDRLYTNLTPVPTAEPTPLPEGVYTPAVIVLLTDGENTAPEDPFEAAMLAADRGVRIHTIGIGSAEGATLEVEGFLIHTQLDEESLKLISELTDGTYYNATNEEELRTIYENLEPQLVVRSDEMEVTSLFAGGSILLMLAGALCSLLWFSRLP